MCFESSARESSFTRDRGVRSRWCMKGEGISEFRHWWLENFHHHIVATYALIGIRCSLSMIRSVGSLVDSKTLISNWTMSDHQWEFLTELWDTLTFLTPSWSTLTISQRTFQNILFFVFVKGQFAKSLEILLVCSGWCTTNCEKIEFRVGSLKTDSKISNNIHIPFNCGQYWITDENL